MKNEVTEKTFDALGDRLKEQEQIEAGRKADATKPLMCRLDGKSFHTFTNGLKRPYDERLSQLMIDTTKFLIEKTNARIGYTQSDEITLCWWNEDDPVHVPLYLFDGKFQKLTSVIASYAGAFFAKELANRIPEKANAIPCFDARIWNVDDIDDVFLNFKWRQDDAIKNSISMAAQAHFSHKSLHKIGSETKKQMLKDIGHPWENEPEFFKMGSFIKRVIKTVELTEDQLSKIPENYQPTGPVQRSFIEVMDFGYIENSIDAKKFFKQISYPQDHIFYY